MPTTRTTTGLTFDQPATGRRRKRVRDTRAEGMCTVSLHDLLPRLDVYLAAHPTPGGRSAYIYAAVKAALAADEARQEIDHGTGYETSRRSR